MNHSVTWTWNQEYILEMESYSREEGGCLSSLLTPSLHPSISDLADYIPTRRAKIMLKHYVLLAGTDWKESLMSHKHTVSTYSTRNRKPDKLHCGEDTKISLPVAAVCLRLYDLIICSSKLWLLNSFSHPMIHVFVFHSILRSTNIWRIKPKTHCSNSVSARRRTRPLDRRSWQTVASPPCSQICSCLLSSVPDG